CCSSSHRAMSTPMKIVPGVNLEPGATCMRPCGLTNSAGATHSHAPPGCRTNFFRKSSTAAPPSRLFPLPDPDLDLARPVLRALGDAYRQHAVLQLRVDRVGF